LERKRRIVISTTRADSVEAAVDRWDADRRDGALRGRGIEQFLLVTDSSTAEVDRLNAAAQRRRIAAVELGEDAIEVRATTPDGGVRREQLREGDRVAFTRQVYLGPGQRRVENGETGTLRRLDADRREVDVELPDRTVSLRGAAVGSLRLGYARHVYSAQGRTVDRVYAVMGGWQTGREGSYVGVSRARESSTVFTDFSSLEVGSHDRKSALRQLAERIGESREKVSAIGWMEKNRTAHVLPAAPRTRGGNDRRPATSSARSESDWQRHVRDHVLRRVQERRALAHDDARPEIT
jgi:ATP-dependent exoDNAse (exonuclease V) alpha subunit